MCHILARFMIHIILPRHILIFAAFLHHTLLNPLLPSGTNSFFARYTYIFPKIDPLKMDTLLIWTFLCPNSVHIYRVCPYSDYDRGLHPPATPQWLYSPRVVWNCGKNFIKCCITCDNYRVWLFCGHHDRLKIGGSVVLQNCWKTWENVSRKTSPVGFMRCRIWLISMVGKGNLRECDLGL